MPKKQWYDVHFSLNGFVKMQATSNEEACLKAEEMLQGQLGSIEAAANTGLGIEVTEAIKEGD